MFSFIKNTERLADSVSRFVSNLAAIILFALVILTCADVIGRYFLNAPVIGAVELVRICMAGIIFFSLPALFFKEDHIIVDLIPFFRSGISAWILNIIIISISVFIALTIADRVSDYAIRAFEDGDVTEYLSIPRYIVVSLITLSIYSCALFAILRVLAMFGKPGEVPSADGEDNK
ncbi:MAG: TRAP transporter small permease [Rhodospirillales bacterium]|jgi:TRAP-type C4-dicarboxylate transport system permease small subunit